MIYTPLMKHQRKALTYLKSHPHCGLFMFLGSGKSLVALAYAEHIKAKRILITSDKNNILNTWPQQIYEHTDFEVLVRPTLKELFSLPDTPTCVLVNYDFLKARYIDFTRHWDLWIGDESSEFKDQRTDRHHKTKWVTGAAFHKIILNGRVMTERLEDVYGQIVMIGGADKIGRTMTGFRRKYMSPDLSGYGWIPRRSALTHIQKDLKELSYWLPDDGTIHMPKRHYHTITVEMTDQQKELDHELKTMFAATLDNIEVETNSAAVVYQKRIQLCGGVLRESESRWGNVASNKLTALERVIKSNPRSKIVVWHTFIPETELLTKSLMIDPVFVMDNPENTDQLVAFREAKASAVLLIRTSLCKGLNQLANADIAVFYSNPLSYARRAQAEGRTRRVDSLIADTHVVDLVTKGGADEQVHHMLAQKKSFSLSLTHLRDMIH